MGGCRAAALTAVLMVLASAAAKPSMCAEVYPDRPVKLVTQGAAGSGPDVIGRIVSDHLGRLWGPPFLRRLWVGRRRVARRLLRILG